MHTVTVTVRSVRFCTCRCETQHDASVVADLIETALKETMSAVTWTINTTREDFVSDLIDKRSNHAQR